MTTVRKDNGVLMAAVNLRVGDYYRTTRENKYTRVDRIDAGCTPMFIHVNGTACHDTRARVVVRNSIKLRLEAATQAAVIASTIPATDPALVHALAAVDRFFNIERRFVEDGAS